MSDTPETDAAEMDGIDCCGEPLKSWDYKPSKDGEVVPAEFARKLERERDEAREELALVRKQLVAANRGAETNAKVNQGLCARLAEAERERDEARRERDEAISKLKFAQNELFTILRFQEDEKREHRNLLERLSFFQNRFESMRAERDQAMSDLEELREEQKEEA